MLNAKNVFRWIALAGAAGASMLVSRQASATNWVMGTVQQASTYWTEVEVVFQVPNAPTTSGEFFSIWAGLEGQDSTLIQPVLQWNQAGSGGWTMQNWFIPGSGGQGQQDNQVGVSAGDWIVAYTGLDTSNPGSGCVKSTGNNCHYVSYWADWTKGYSRSKEWTMPVGPVWALGNIFEAPFGTYDSCANFPTGTMQIATYLYEYSSPSNPFASVTPNFTVETPGSNYPFMFTDAYLNNPSNGHVYGNCVAITYPWGGSNNQTLYWMNAY